MKLDILFIFGMENNFSIWFICTRKINAICTEAFFFKFNIHSWNIHTNWKVEKKYRTMRTGSVEGGVPCIRHIVLVVAVLVARISIPLINYNLVFSFEVDARASLRCARKKNHLNRYRHSDSVSRCQFNCVCLQFQLNIDQTCTLFINRFWNIHEPKLCQEKKHFNIFCWLNLFAKKRWR